METSKKPVFQLAIPRAMSERIRRIFKPLGYQSIPDFVQQATMDKLPREENRFDELQSALKSGEAQKWEK
jgi:hypothetical protein